MRDNHVLVRFTEDDVKEDRPAVIIDTRTVGMLHVFGCYSF